MKTVRFLLEPLRELFARLRAVTMPEMKAALGTNVDVTVFRKLRDLSYHSSYSHRGGFYTLDSIAQFDEQGLWCCRDAWFSRHGTLLDTAQAMVSTSAAGYFADELEDVLHVSVKDALRRLVNQRRLGRQNLESRYLYTASDRTRRQEQLAARNAQIQARDPQEQTMRAAIVLFYSLLDEQQRRLYAGLESLKHGHGGDRQMAEYLGLNVETVARGRRDILAGEIQRGRVRRTGGGRPRAEKKRPTS